MMPHAASKDPVTVKPHAADARRVWRNSPCSSQDRCAHAQSDTCDCPEVGRYVSEEEPQVGPVYEALWVAYADHETEAGYSQGCQQKEARVQQRFLHSGC